MTCTQCIARLLFLSLTAPFAQLQEIGISRLEAVRFPFSSRQKRQFPANCRVHLLIAKRLVFVALLAPVSLFSSFPDDGEANIFVQSDKFQTVLPEIPGFQADL
jgi:hypothetical protein